MGECKLHLNQLKEAIQYFSNAVRIRPKNIAGWEALIRCLYRNDFFAEARQQTIIALDVTKGKPIFLFYLSAVLFALGKSKDAKLYLQKGLEAAPKALKKFIDLNPRLLQNQTVVETIAQYKKTKP
jgi:tetratricopeptide (TPR) repeat protein